MLQLDSGCGPELEFHRVSQLAKGWKHEATQRPLVPYVCEDEPFPGWAFAVLIVYSLVLFLSGSMVSVLVLSDELELVSAPVGWLAVAVVVFIAFVVHHRRHRIRYRLNNQWLERKSVQGYEYLSLDEIDDVLIDDDAMNTSLLLRSGEWIELRVRGDFGRKIDDLRHV
jgi:hypothetical protein